MKRAKIQSGELLRDRKLVLELGPGYVWIGCADEQGQHCVGTVDLTELRKILPRRKRRAGGEP